MVHVVECSDMSRKSVKKTLRNTVVEYSAPTIKDRKTSLSWIISVLQSPLLKIKNITLDDLSRSGDEGNSSSTVGEKDTKQVQVRHFCKRTISKSIWNERSRG